MCSDVQTSIFDVPEPSGRRTDPISSHVTVKSLGKDTSLKMMVLRAFIEASWNGDEVTLASDDRIVAVLEATYQRRFQRNVVARTRGLLEPEWVWRVGTGYDDRSRPVLYFVPTKAALRWAGIIE
jgi:hypothetical protein